MATPAEIGGVTLVFVGALNPAILQPAWLAAQELIRPEEAEQISSDGEILSIGSELTIFDGGWFVLEATRERLTLAATEGVAESLLPLRDLAVGIFTVLPHTPLRQMGLNHSRHIALANERWGALAAELAPPAEWSRFVSAPSLKTIRVDGHRHDDDVPGSVEVTLEPSRKILGGVYVNVNDHVEFSDSTVLSADAAIEVLTQYWESSLKSADKIFAVVRDYA